MCFLKFSSKIGWFFVYDLIFMSLFTVQNLTNGCFRTILNRFGSGQVWTGLVSKSLGNMPRGLCAYSSYGQYMSNVPPRFAQYMAKVWPRYAHVQDITKWHTMSPGRKWDKMSTGTKCRWDKMFPNHLCHIGYLEYSNPSANSCWNTNYKTRIEIFEECDSDISRVCFYII